MAAGHLRLRAHGGPPFFLRAKKHFCQRRRRPVLPPLSRRDDAVWNIWIYSTDRPRYVTAIANRIIKQESFAISAVLLSSLTNIPDARSTCAARRAIRNASAVRARCRSPVPPWTADPPPADRLIHGRYNNHLPETLQNTTAGNPSAAADLCPPFAEQPHSTPSGLSSSPADETVPAAGNAGDGT